MELQEFLCGADGADPWCRQHFDDYTNDINKEWEADNLQILRDGYFLAPSQDSMLLLQLQGQDYAIVGYYNPPGAVCIHDAHQGKGLGAELILATYEWLGCPPTEGLDEQCFSQAGYAAHIKAWNLGVERGVFLEDTPNAPAFG
jgi:GNAT superfamily N-acetyltransferase